MNYEIKLTPQTFDYFLAIFEVFSNVFPIPRKLSYIAENK